MSMQITITDALRDRIAQLADKPSDDVIVSLALSLLYDGIAAEEALRAAEAEGNEEVAPGFTYKELVVLWAVGREHLAPLAPFWPIDPSHGRPINLVSTLAQYYALAHRVALTLPLLRGMTEAALRALAQIGPARADIIRRTIAKYDEATND